MTPLSEELFLLKGYRKFNNTHYRNEDYTFQKRIRDSEGNTKYFITVYVYDFSKFGVDKVSYEAEAIMWDDPNDSDAFYRIVMSVKGVDDMEQRFEKLHKHFGEVLDFHNN